MPRIHVRLNLEYKAGHLLFARFHNSLFALAVKRRGSIVHELIQQFFHTEITNRRTEKDRRLFSREIVIDRQLRTGAPDEFDLFSKFGSNIAERLGRLVRIQAVDHQALRRLLPADLVVKINLVLQQVVDAL